MASSRFWIPLIELGLLVFLPLSFLSWGNYTVPLFDRLLGRRHTALVLRSLALVVEGGKPIALGLSTLTQHYPTGWVRAPAASGREGSRHGADWIESLRQHRLDPSGRCRCAGVSGRGRQPGVGADGTGGNRRAPAGDPISDGRSRRCSRWLW